MRRILIDDIDIRDINLSDLRCCIGWASQDVGSFDASHDEILHAPKLAEAHEFILQLPDPFLIPNSG
jgi:ATP-binding cassette subfamily B protein